MKLNDESKAKIRNFIANKIKEAEEKQEISVGNRIKLDKKSLEELLFEEKISNAGVKYKTIAWTEYGLSKIDLSKIDFSNVLWESEEVVDLSNSNAKIDFETSYSRLISAQDMPVRVVNFNFENVDLRNANGHLIGYSSGSNYKGTKVGIKSPKGRKFIDCNLEGFDFSRVTLQSKVYDLSSAPTVCTGTNFTNTGITIIAKNTDMEAVAKEIRNGNLYGCYVNTTYIPNAEETKKKKEEVLEQYAAFEDEYKKAVNLALSKASFNAQTQMLY